jgi:predicted nucleic acid-binding protein
MATKRECAPNGLISDLENGFIKGATSEVVATELKSAPDAVKKKYLQFLETGIELYNIDKNVEMLTDAYLSHKIVTKKFKNDLVHIALATVNNADILVSWNFKHIVHYDKISKFNAVNLEYGYRSLTILSPREVTSYE